jgi:hypothetical protein
LAETITAIATLVTAVGGVILAFTVLLPLLRRTKSLETVTAAVAAKVDEVHVISNSNHEAMLRREEVLISALQFAGIAIPPNEAIALKKENPEEVTDDGS